MPSKEEPFNPVPAPPSHDVTLSGVDSLFEPAGAESLQEEDERYGAEAEK